MPHSNQLSQIVKDKLSVDGDYMDVIRTSLQTPASGYGSVFDSAVATVTESSPVIHTTEIVLTNLSISMSDDADDAGQYGGTQIYTFPAGLIFSLGSTITGTFTGATPIVNAWAGDASLGAVVPPDYATSTTGNSIAFMQMKAVGPATSKVATLSAVSSATVKTDAGGSWLDGTAVAKKCFLNLRIDDEAAHTDGALVSFTGTVRLNWINLGDI